jgi:hypothetical protein
MALELRPWDDHDALIVFRTLDHHDQAEAEAVRGRSATGVQLWADWRSVEQVRIVSILACADGTPFAALGLSHTGQAGVAEAALLARNHRRFRVPLGRLAVLIRRRLPIVAAETGIHRIEARAWAGHPTAALLLQGCGFHLEAVMRGFGADGRQSFRQYAWVAPRATQES